jgi:hypothetical protein
MNRKNISRGLLLLGLFLVVFGARLWLIEQYASEVPFWDQWDAEGYFILKPWVEGHLTLQQLFAAHNEHRIVLTRLLTIGLFALNRQWDPLVEMTVNAGICSLVAVFIAAMLLRYLPRRQSWPGLVLLIVLFVLPFSWENTLSGFQSQFYFLVLFSFVAIWGVGLHRAASSSWWMGVLALILASLSMASGFFAAVVIIAVILLRWIKEDERPDKSSLVSCLIAFAAIVIGWMTRTVVPGHAGLMAENFTAWTAALGRSLAWPHCSEPLFAFAMQLPIAALSLKYLIQSRSRQREQKREAILLVLGIGLWCVGQAAAVAYARGSQGQPPASRYMDVLAIGALVNFIAALMVATAAWPTRWRIPTCLGSVAWLGLLSWGLITLTQTNFSFHLPDRCAHLVAGTRYVSGYVRTGDARTYLEHKPYLDLSHPDPARLRTILDDATIRLILPAGLRSRLHLREANPSETFVQPGVPAETKVQRSETVRGSYLAQAGGAAIGTWKGEVEGRLGFPYMRVDVIGGLGNPGLEMQLCDPGTGACASLHPAQPAGARWQTNFVRAPSKGSKALIVSANDQSKDSWFGFMEPVEIGPLSYWNLQILGRSDLISGGGLMLLILAMIAELWMGGPRKSLNAPA